jgi:isoquinoline 1-oxidoreductase beta subunit
LYAVIARSPYFDGTLRTLDDSAAKNDARRAGHRADCRPKPTEDLVRNLAAGVAVVADNTWAAMQARKALRIEWTAGVWAQDSTQALEARARAAVAAEDNVQTGRSDGDMKALGARPRRRSRPTTRCRSSRIRTMEPPARRSTLTVTA